MKYIKAYKLFEDNNSELISKLKEFGIKNYTINNDNSIDVNSPIFIHSRQLTEIPFNFGKVSMTFFCGYNKLTSLEGCPSEIGGNFNCKSNKLQSLEFCASEIGIDFDCSENQLTMLDCSSYVKGHIYCYGMFNEEPEFFGDCEGKIYW